jgi:small-conductance mechanosensitive channel
VRRFPRRRKLPRELFQTRTHAWQSLGLGDELLPRAPGRGFGSLLIALAVLAATLFVYSNRGELLPGFGEWVRIGTVAVLVIVGAAATHWLGQSLTPRLYRRLDPATAGTLGFVMRLLAMAMVLVVALRIAGVNAAALAVGGAFTAIVLGLAAQQTLAGIFAGILLQSTRPFRLGERVRLVGGALAGSLEGTVSSLGLFYTPLVQGADRLLVPNSVLVNLVVVPLREPEKVDLRARFPSDASPKRIEERLLEAISVPTRYAPSVSLEELDDGGTVFRVTATPLRPDDGSQLAEEVLDALRGGDGDGDGAQATRRTAGSRG